MTEAERIKDRLRACKTPDEVNAIADEERANVKALAETDRVMAIQIANLKAYMLGMFKGS